MYICKGIKKLPKPTVAQIDLQEKGLMPRLTIIRNGNIKSLPISKAVAAELIALGFGYGG